MKKIEEIELQQLQELQQKYQIIINNLGEISLNKILLDQKEINIKHDLKLIQDEEKTLKDFLIQKYGDSLNINIENGEY